MKVNDEFLFGCSTGMWVSVWGDRKGIVELHAYSIMRAVEMDGQRLVLLKNPWGKGEWKGAWSDGSKEWTAEWLTKLGHRFGDDGNFWISYDDLLRKYQAFDRTRLFGPEWKITSIWTTVSVPWTLDYHDTYFTFSLAKTGPVVLVLSQLDNRYYRGLEGQYRFELNFRLHKKGQEDYVVRSIASYRQTRSVNVELELEAGEYTVLMKIDATRDLDILPIEEVIRNYARDRRDKLVAVGMSTSIIGTGDEEPLVIGLSLRSKGKMIETKEEKQAKKAAEKRKEDKERELLKKEIMKARRDTYYLEAKEHKKQKERKQKARAKQRAKKAARAAKEEAKADPEPTEAKDVPSEDVPSKDAPSDSQKDPQDVSTQSPSAEPNGGQDPTPSPEVVVTAEAEAKSDDAPSPKSGESAAKGDAPNEANNEANKDTPGTTVVADQTTADKEQDVPAAPSPDARGDEADSLSSEDDDSSEVSSVSEISNTELEIRFKERGPTPEPSPPAPVAPAVPEEEEDEPNPYAKSKGEDADDKDKDEDAEEKADDEEAEEVSASKGLDVDDSSKE
ncbi:hypothetical protein ONZ43_g7571 [Nemania bipapillata]|uniref:Uncharacterized protein n=1 Tax=Nemania bipapillata TaxID=110536 RepID=A0ACC2HQ40_9PEZI|nr:hypothetical protein ONZ43_g7571 [Nemania bipapillata]